MDSQGVEVFHIADGEADSGGVAHHLEFYLLPASERLLHQYLRGEGEGFRRRLVQLGLIVTESGTETSQGVCGADYDGVAYLFRRFSGIFEGFDGMGAYRFDIDFVKSLDEEVTVFGVHYHLDGSAQHLYSVLFEEAFPVEFHSAVQRSLSAEGEEDGVRLLLFYHFLHEMWGDREEIYLVGHSFRGLDGSDVGVYQDGVDTVVFHRLESLGSAVVEFTGLADFECSRTEHQDFFYGTVFHYFVIVSSVWQITGSQDRALPLEPWSRGCLQQASKCLRPEQQGFSPLSASPVNR